MLSFGCSCGNDDREKNLAYTFNLSAEILNLEVGQSYKIKFLETDEYEHRFTIDDDSVATIDSEGLVFAKKTGSATVSVTSNGVTKTCKVNVTDNVKPVVTFNNVRDNVLRLIKDQGYSIDYSITFGGESLEVEVSFSTSDETVASVENGRLSAVNYGTAEITMSFEYLIWSETEKIEVQVVEDVSLNLPTFGIELTVDGEYNFSAEQCYVLHDGEKVQTQIEFRTEENEEIVSVAGYTVTALKAGSTRVFVNYTVNDKHYTNYVFVKVNKKQLTKPQNLAVNGTVVSWDKVEDEHCCGYRLFVDTVEMTADKILLKDETSYELKDYYYLGSKLFAVIAVSNNETEYSSSEKAYLNFTFESVQLDEKMKKPDNLDAGTIELQSNFKDADIYYAECGNSSYTKGTGNAFLKTYFAEVIGTSSSIAWFCNNALISMKADRGFYNGKVITFWVYTLEDTTFRHIEWATGEDIQTPIDAKAGVWTKIAFTVNMTYYKELSFIAVTKGTKGAVEFYYTDIRISLPDYVVPSFADCAFYPGYGVEEAIDSLIEEHYNGEVLIESSLRCFDETNILSALSLYGELSPDKQAAIDKSKLEKLNAIREKYYEKFVPIETFTDKNRILLWDNKNDDGIKVNADVSHPYTVGLSLGKDDVFGTCLDMNVHQYQDSWTILGVKIEHSIIKYKFSDAEEKLDGCLSVEFYIYNGAERDFGIYTNFGGTATASYRGIVLKAGEWTRVEISVSEFLSGNSIGIAYTSDYGAGPYVFRISGIYGVKDNNTDLYVTDDYEPINIPIG